MLNKWIIFDLSVDPLSHSRITRGWASRSPLLHSCESLSIELMDNFWVLFNRRSRGSSDTLLMVLVAQTIFSYGELDFRRLAVYILLGAFIGLTDCGEIGRQIHSARRDLIKLHNCDVSEPIWVAAIYNTQSFISRFAPYDGNEFWSWLNGEWWDHHQIVIPQYSLHTLASLISSLEISAARLSLSPLINGHSKNDSVWHAITWKWSNRVNIANTPNTCAHQPGAFNALLSHVEVKMCSRDNLCCHSSK